MDGTEINASSSQPEFGLTVSERQILQIVHARTQDNSVYMDWSGLKTQMDQVEYPIHMIDFETSSPAIPFYANTRAYDQIAFQFSHHIIEEDGSVRHANQWLNPDPKRFPNFEFVRALKKAVGDKGSIFRYSHHENTILNVIHDQLSNSDEPDKKALQNWIETITARKNAWVGQRNMIDLCKWVEAFYFDPATKGSNSIKAILPSILNTSNYLQLKYAQPVYGSIIPSLNMEPTVWLKYEDGLLLSPYKQLPNLSFLNDSDEDQLDLFMKKEALADGGSAMMAYNYMQFKSMSDREEKTLRKALLRYCELDTLAMVMLWEGFKAEVDNR
jgi:hypothetical protein